MHTAIMRERENKITTNEHNLRLNTYGHCEIEIRLFIAHYLYKATIRLRNFEPFKPSHIMICIKASISVLDNNSIKCLKYRHKHTYAHSYIPVYKLYTTQYTKQTIKLVKFCISKKKKPNKKQKTR